MINQGEHPIDPYELSVGNEIQLPVSLEQYLPILALGLDVEVLFERQDGKQSIAHKAVDSQTAADRLNWIKSLVDPIATIMPRVMEVAEHHAPRLRVLRENGRVVGVAALAMNMERLSQLTFTTVGGLGTSISGGYGGYVGYLDNAAANAKRDAGNRCASDETIQTWVNEQIALLGDAGKDKAHLTIASYNISMIPADVSLVAHAAFYPRNGSNNIEFLSLDEVIDRIRTEPMAVYVVRIIGIADIYTPRAAYHNHLTFQPLGVGNFGSVYNANQLPLTSSSFFFCLEKRADERGLTLKRRVVETMPAPPFDQIDVYLFEVAAKAPPSGP